MATRLTWKWIAGAAIALVVGAAGTTIALLNGDDNGDDAPAAVASTTPSPSPAPSPSISASPPEFDEDDIVLLASKERFVQAYYVADSDRRLYSLARKCVDYLLLDEKWNSVNCYVYDSQEALDYSQVSQTFGVAPAHLCWRAFYARSVTGATSGAKLNPQYESEGCPQA